MTIRLNRTGGADKTIEPASKNTSLPGCRATVIIIIYYSINDKALGQQEQEQQQPTNNTDNLEIIIQQNNRIIQQNDETAIQDRVYLYRYYRITC